MIIGRLMVAFVALTLLSGCFDGYMDCDSQENLDYIKQEVRKGVTWYSDVKRSKGKIQVYPELTLKLFNQYEVSKTSNTCNYVFNANTGGVGRELPVNAKIQKLENSDTSHDVALSIDKEDLYKVIRTAEYLSSKINDKENAEKYGFENAESYVSFINLKAKIDEALEREESYKKEIAEWVSNKKAEEAKLSKQQKKFETMMQVLIDKIGAGKHSYELAEGIKITIHEVDLKDRTLSGTFINPQEKSFESVSLGLRVFDKNDYKRTLFSTHDRKGAFSDAVKSTNVRVSIKSPNSSRSGSRAKSGKFHVNFNEDTNLALDKVETKLFAKGVNPVVLTVPRSYSIGWDYFGNRDLEKHDLSTINRKQLNIILNLQNKIRRAEREIKTKKGYLDKSQQKRTLLSAKAKSLNANNSLELSVGG